ncbi:unnamed protein product, partial [Gordionus sp. m RMFG-2023]
SVIEKYTTGDNPLLSRVYMSFSRPQLIEFSRETSSESTTTNHVQGDISEILKNIALYSNNFDIDNAPKYIQDNLIASANDLVPRILNKTAIIYLSGDAKGFSPSIRKCFSRMLKDYPDLGNVLNDHVETRGEDMKCVMATNFGRDNGTSKFDDEHTIQKR